MENIKLNFSPFYVGQKVVCVESSRLKFLVKDIIYTVRALHQYKCGCWVVDVGVQRNMTAATHCHSHPSFITEGDSWFAIRFFAPLEERFISLAEVIKIESQVTCVN